MPVFLVHFILTHRLSCTKHRGNGRYFDTSVFRKNEKAATSAFLGTRGRESIYSVQAGANATVSLNDEAIMITAQNSAMYDRGNTFALHAALWKSFLGEINCLIEDLDKKDKDSLMAPAIVMRIRRHFSFWHSKQKALISDALVRKSLLNYEGDEYGDYGPSMEAIVEQFERADIRELYDAMAIATAATNLAQCFVNRAIACYLIDDHITKVNLVDWFKTKIKTQDQRKAHTTLTGKNGFRKKYYHAIARTRWICSNLEVILAYHHPEMIQSVFGHIRCLQTKPTENMAVVVLAEHVLIPYLTNEANTQKGENEETPYLIQAEHEDCILLLNVTVFPKSTDMRVVKYLDEKFNPSQVDSKEQLTLKTHLRSCLAIFTKDHSQTQTELTGMTIRAKDPTKAHKFFNNVFEALGLRLASTRATVAVGGKRPSYQKVLITAPELALGLLPKHEIMRKMFIRATRYWYINSKCAAERTLIQEAYEIYNDKVDRVTMEANRAPAPAVNMTTGTTPQSAQAVRTPKGDTIPATIDITAIIGRCRTIPEHTVAARMMGTVAAPPATTTTSSQSSEDDLVPVTTTTAAPRRSVHPGSMIEQFVREITTTENAQEEATHNAHTAALGIYADDESDSDGDESDEESDEESGHEHNPFVESQAADSQAVESQAADVRPLRVNQEIHCF